MKCIYTHVLQQCTAIKVKLHLKTGGVIKDNKLPIVWYFLIYIYVLCRPCGKTTLVFIVTCITTMPACDDVSEQIKRSKLPNYLIQIKAFLHYRP